VTVFPIVLHRRGLFSLDQLHEPSWRLLHESMLHFHTHSTSVDEFGRLSIHVEIYPTIGDELELFPKILGNFENWGNNIFFHSEIFKCFI
jgi:hypothetical protein